MSALRSFYGYYFKHQIIEKNPTLFVDMPKLHEKAIVRLDTDEVASLLDFVEHGGDELTGQKKFTMKRLKPGSGDYHIAPWYRNPCIRMCGT